MAELPRYQEMGLIAADQARIQFADTQEQARFSAVMSQQLDRLSSFAFGIAAERQAEENRLVGIQMRAELEGEVQKQLSDIKVRIKTGQLTDVDQVQQEIQAMQGLVKPLAEIDINQANALMSSIAAGGRQLIAKSSDTQIKLYQEQVAAQLSDMMPAFQNNFSTIYETTFNPEDIQTQKAEMRNKLYAMVATTSPELVPAAMKEFESRWTAARDEALIGYFTSSEFGRSPASGVKALRNGNAGKYTEVWSSLGADEQNAIVKSYLARDAQEANLRGRADGDIKANIKSNTQIVLGRYEIGDLSAADVITMANAGEISLTNAEYRGIIKGDVGGMEEDKFESIKSGVIKGFYGETDIDRMVDEGYLNIKQANSAKNLLVTNMNRDMNDAYKYINDSFVPDPLSPGDRNNKQRAAELRAELLREQQRALDEGVPFNPKKWSMDAVEQRKKLEDFKALEKAQDQLRVELDQLGIDYNEDLTREDLRNMDVDTDAMARVMRRIQTVQRLR